MNRPKRLPPLGGAGYLKITILSLGLTALSQSLHGIILPLRVLDFVGEAGKNTALAALTFTGLVLAMLSQPIASAFSDSTASRWGRRKPYVLLGGFAVLLFLPGIGLAGTYAFLFVAYCLIQLAANTAQGPYQGYLPEMVPLDHRGRASSLKSQMELFGGAVGVIVIGRLMSGYSADNSTGLWASITGLSLVMGVILLYLWRSLRERPVISPPKPFRNPLLSYRINLRDNPAFGWLLGSRLFVFMASATIQTFALFYLRDVLGVTNPAGFTASFMVTAVASMALAIFPAGYFADRYGKGRLSLAAAFLGGLGVLTLLLWPSTTTLLVAAGMVGYAVGTFGVTNWAMATELVIKGEEARYLAIANMATAGGAALARLIGPVIDHFNRVELNLGYQVMLGACVVYFVIGGLLVMKVRRPTSR
jgi:Na+/melibiose symporter-like transporter